MKDLTIPNISQILNTLLPNILLKEAKVVLILNKPDNFLNLPSKQGVEEG